MQAQSEVFLNQYHNLLRKAAWQTSRDIGADFEDAMGEAYLIFCEAIKKYDENYGAKFGTYLTHCLRDLKRRVFVCWKNYVELDEIPDVEGYNMTSHIQTNAMFLDDDAKTLLDALMLGRFDINGTKQGGRQNPGFQTVYRVMRQHNWTWARCRRGWDSLKQWWREN